MTGVGWGYHPLSKVKTVLGDKADGGLFLFLWGGGEKKIAYDKLRSGV